METTVTEAEATAAVPFHQSLSTIVPVQVLDDERLTLIEPFYVVVEASNGSFVATFFDAHISSSGDTPCEAVDNVKDLVVAAFHRLSRAPAERLGPVPTRQIAVLHHFISPIAG